MKYINRRNLQSLIRANAFSNFLNLSSVQLYNTLLSFIIYPIITRKFGLEAFGLFTTANYFAGLMGTIVNYGTSQSGVKDVAINKDNRSGLSSAFYNTLILRLLIFAGFLGVFSLVITTISLDYTFYLFAIPMIFSEALNPMFLFLGKEKLSLYNIANLIAKLLTILAVLFLINGEENAKWINFAIGTINSLIYLLLIVYGVRSYRLSISPINRLELKGLFKNNFYLVGNNISVHLQQSFMIFAINLWGNLAWLGAYSICDKIIGSVKMLISSVSNAIYPKAAFLFKDDPGQFAVFTSRMKTVLTFSLLAFSLSLMILAGPVVHLVNGGPDATAETLLRIMAFLPTLAAFNVINVLDLLVRDHNVYIFKIALILLFIAVVLSCAVVFIDNIFLFGAYTLMIEGCAILMYEYVRKKNPVILSRL